MLNGGCLEWCGGYGGGVSLASIDVVNRRNRLRDRESYTVVVRRHTLIGRSERKRLSFVCVRRPGGCRL
jgi:hypothetical protein